MSYKDQLRLNSRLEVFLFGGAQEEPDKMFERDTYSRAGDSGRWPANPHANAISPELGTLIGTITVDRGARFIGYSPCADSPECEERSATTEFAGVSKR